MPDVQTIVQQSNFNIALYPNNVVRAKALFEATRAELTSLNYVCEINECNNTITFINQHRIRVAFTHGYRHKRQCLSFSTIGDYEEVVKIAIEFNHIKSYLSEPKTGFIIKKIIAKIIAFREKHLIALNDDLKRLNEDKLLSDLVHEWSHKLDKRHVRIYKPSYRADNSIRIVLDISIDKAKGILDLISYQLSVEERAETL